VVARELERGLELHGRAVRYLTLYGDKVGEHWRAEVARLEAWGQFATVAEREECCKAARAVFGAFSFAFHSLAVFPEPS
jgi:heme oxygenase